MEQLIAEYSETDRETTPLTGDVDPIGADFRETVRKGPSETTDE